MVTDAVLRISSINLTIEFSSTCSEAWSEDDYLKRWMAFNIWVCRLSGNQYCLELVEGNLTCRKTATASDLFLILLRLQGVRLRVARGYSLKEKLALSITERPSCWYDDENLIYLKFLGGNKHSCLISAFYTKFKIAVNLKWLFKTHFPCTDTTYFNFQIMFFF